MDSIIKSTIVNIKSPNGLHARPAAMIVRSLKPLNCDVSLFYQGMQANAKNILEIMSMAAVHGSDLEVKAQGLDADQALILLEELFESGFGEV